MTSRAARALLMLTTKPSHAETINGPLRRATDKGDLIMLHPEDQKELLEMAAFLLVMSLFFVGFLSLGGTP